MLPVTTYKIINKIDALWLNWLLDDDNNQSNWKTKLLIKIFSNDYDKQYSWQWKPLDGIILIIMKGVDIIVI